MKKIIKGLLCVGLAFGIFGCQKKLSKEDVGLMYRDALVNMAQTMNFTVDGTIKISLGDEGASLSMDMGVLTLIDGTDLDDGKMLMQISTSMFGLETTVETIYANDHVYTNSMDMKTKEVVSPEDNIFYQLKAMLPLLSVAAKNDTVDMSGNFDFTYVEIEDGIRITIVVKPEDVNDILNQFQGQEIPTDFVFNDLSMTVDINKDKLITNLTMMMDIDMSDPTFSTGFKMDMNLNVKDYGVTKVELPSDLDSYKLLEPTNPADNYPIEAL